MKTACHKSLLISLLSTLVWLSVVAAKGQIGAGYEIYVSNERSGDLTVLEGRDFKVKATIPVGKRPRGIHASADGKTVYVALSGTPISEPPPLDAKGNPIFKKDQDDDDDSAKADKAADGIGVVDVANRRFLRKIAAGSDPEQFSLSADGSQLYVSNEDVGTASVLDVANGRVEHIIVVSREPEGVGTAPGGKTFYVTCETGGIVYVIDAKTCKEITHFTVNPRPRSLDFAPDGARAYIPSESVGQLNFVNCVTYQLEKRIDLPKGSRPMCVKVAPDGKKVYVSTGRAGTVCVLDAASGAVLNSIPVGKRPWGIALSPDGKYLFAANGPSNDISVVDLVTEKEVARVKAGASPWGVVVIPKPM